MGFPNLPQMVFRDGRQACSVMFGYVRFWRKKLPQRHRGHRGRCTKVSIVTASRTQSPNPARPGQTRSPSESNLRDGSKVARSNWWYGQSQTSKERRDADRAVVCDWHHWDPAGAVPGANIEGVCAREEDAGQLGLFYSGGHRPSIVPKNSRVSPHASKVNCSFPWARLFVIFLSRRT